MSDANVRNRSSRNVPSIALTAGKLYRKDRRLLSNREAEGTRDKYAFMVKPTRASFQVNRGLPADFNSPLGSSVGGGLAILRRELVRFF